MSLNRQQKPQYAVAELIAFYYRVNPALSKWLAKPTWTARETAMLCAGYAPNECLSEESPPSKDIGDEIVDGTPLDSEEYLASSPTLYGNFLRQLRSVRADAAPPAAMMRKLGVTRGIAKSGHGKDAVGVVFKISLSANAIGGLEWLFIIANAVGLPLPAIVPFGLIGGLQDYLMGNLEGERDAVRRTGHTQVRRVQSGSETSEQSLTGATESNVSPVLEVRNHSNSRGRQPYELSPIERGFYTTEEVAGLTHLLPGTLTKYARENRPVAGFNPYKLLGSKGWRWRDEKQQSQYTVVNAAAQ